MSGVAKIIQKLCFSQLCAKNFYSSAHRHAIFCSVHVHTASLQEHQFRKFSSKRPGRLDLLSDVEDYVQRHFELSDLQKKIDNENLPAQVTTESLLQECKTVIDVLGVLQNSVLTGKLWRDEITLYLKTLLKMKREIFKETSLDFVLHHDCDEMVKSSLQELHDNPYFQFLIKEALTHASTLTTEQLTDILSSFVQLKIPPVSNTMLLLVRIIQTRINELFPRDVMKCFISIHALKCDGVSHINALREGLLMHLENQMDDEPTFKKLLMATAVSDRLSLLLFLGGRASHQLRLTVFYSIVSTVRSRPGRELWNVREAASVLKVLRRGRLSGRFLLRSAINYLHDNAHEVTDHHRILIREIKEVMILDEFDIPSRLLQTAGDGEKQQKRAEYHHSN